MKELTLDYLTFKYHTNEKLGIAKKQDVVFRIMIVLVLLGYSSVGEAFEAHVRQTKYNVGLFIVGKKNLR